jgi:hypothetical protein
MIGETQMLFDDEGGPKRQRHSATDDTRRHRGSVDWEGGGRPPHGSRDAALLDAARAMFELNHYANNAGRDTKKRIYDVKGRFIKHLWESGHCTSVHRHVEEHDDGVECRACNGEGCDRCDNTGFWRLPKTFGFLCFRFEVEGQRFCWRQPAKLTEWVPEERIEDEPDTAWVPGRVSDAIKPQMGFAKAYALLEWVLGNDEGAPSDENAAG